MNIRELASVIRTKNAGPGVITREHVAGLYRVPIEDILSIYHFDEGKCIKINIKRPVPSGDIGDTDVLAMQQHAPLLLIDIP
jgi:hypothetical protein